MAVSLEQPLDEQHAPIGFRHLLQQLPGKERSDSRRDTLALILQPEYLHLALSYVRATSSSASATMQGMPGQTVMI